VGDPHIERPITRIEQQRIAIKSIMGEMEAQTKKPKGVSVELGLKKEKMTKVSPI